MFSIPIVNHFNSVSVKEWSTIEHPLTETLLKSLQILFRPFNYKHYRLIEIYEDISIAAKCIVHLNEGHLSESSPVMKGIVSEWSAVNPYTKLDESTPTAPFKIVCLPLGYKLFNFIHHGKCPE